ncbi:MAG: NUDIX domain-containing protein [Chloroflexota bacterium]
MPQRTPVVTCFLLRRRPGREGVPQDEVLLLRRSDRVGTYRRRWAGVSGYVEAPPEEQAYREIQEETGLERDDVELLRHGEHLDIPDKALDKIWSVHPFLFLVRDPSKMRTGWEHMEARWVRPARLADYDTVPGLADALARVYPLPSRAA